MIDIHILPQKAQNELIDFYQFLVERYAKEMNKKQVSKIATTKQIDNFFDGYNLDLTDFINLAKIWKETNDIMIMKMLSILLSEDEETEIESWNRTKKLFRDYFKNN